MKPIVDTLSEEKLLPLYTVTDLNLLPKLEELLLKHNLHFIEITYRSSLASEAIHQLSQNNQLIVGAGTVCDIKTAKEAVNNGAQFIVMPGIDSEVIKYCNNLNIPVFPGAVTPTEIITALNLGLSTVKFFPANIYGGIDAINNLKGPFPNVKFIPTGGINADNVLEFLCNDSVLAVGGSFIISEKALIKDADKVSHNIQEIQNKLNSLSK